MGNPDQEFVRTAAPLYRDVAAALERRIRSGAWKPGDQIPTEVPAGARIRRQPRNAADGHRRAASSGACCIPSRAAAPSSWVRPSPASSASSGTRARCLRRAWRRTDTVLRREDRPSGRLRSQRASGLENGEDVRPCPPPAASRQRALPADRLLLPGCRLATDRICRLRAAFSLRPAARQLRGLRDQRPTSTCRAGLADGSGVTASCTSRLEARSSESRRTALTFERRPIEFRRAVGRADRFRYHVRLE